jgi:CO/xanthine dehydrogenase FAD-binding subunit
MAISKVALAATAIVDEDKVSEIRLAAASLAPFPARLYQTESALLCRSIDARTIEAAREAMLAEAKPIDDIRSTADYRNRVGANLLEEFLQELQSEVI